MNCRIIYLMSSTRASYLTLHSCDTWNRSLLCTSGHNPREQLTAASSGHSRPKFSSKHCWTRVCHLDNCTFWPLQATQQCLSSIWGSSKSIMRAQTLLLFAKRAFSSSPPTQATTTSPLKGVKVLDLTRVLAGPFATMVLSDLGAEVIKVERPGGGDDTRAWGPPFLHSEQGRESAYFLSVNRNKQSICVDMKSERGVKILHQLAAKADILVENYLPGKVFQFYFSTSLSWLHLA